MNKKHTVILKVLVGSQAHGLADEKSDYDYRGVFVTPTSDLLKLGAKYKSNSWFEGKEDQTLYEIGHFLHLATKCNPSILEVFKAPIIDTYYEDYGENLENIFDWGKELKELFPYIWNPNDAFNAFVGYSNNQRKKLLDKKDDRGPKFACAYLRTLHNLKSLLKSGDFSLKIPKEIHLYNRLKDIRKGYFSMGDVINEAEEIVEDCKILRDKCKHKPDLNKVNNFLLKVRKEFWS